jgi:hypothetical protein
LPEFILRDAALIAVATDFFPDVEIVGGSRPHACHSLPSFLVFDLKQDNLRAARTVSPVLLKR